jgi:electron transfer flavoprotein alpha subunit
MGNVLVFVEERDGEIAPTSREALGAARTFAAGVGCQVEAIVLRAEAAPRPIEAPGADVLLCVTHPTLANICPEAALAVVESVVRQREPAAIVFTYDAVGLDLASGLAMRADRPLLSHVIGFAVQAGQIEARSQAYGGKAIVESRAAFPVVLTLMPGAFKEAAGRAAPEIVELEPPERLDRLRTEFVAETRQDTSGFDLTVAEKVVCIGRGAADESTLALARGLAATLGAEIAGSRPIVDKGWLPKERQVGKSGRKIKPKLYLALGVSGAPEHLEGMSGAELIVAVNTDPSAPIFGVAHYGATVDLGAFAIALGAALKAGA